MSKALIVFARNVSAGPVKTRLQPDFSPEQSRALYEAFLADIGANVAMVGATVRWYVTPGPKPFIPPGVGSVHLQEGDGLGQRMAAAFRQTQAAGFASVVIIGTDTPSLPNTRIRAAFGILEDGGDSVLGPAEDGGYYLLGLRGRDPSFLEAIAYSRPDVLTETVKHLPGAQLLDTWNDVDTPADLERLRTRLEAEPWRAPRTAAVLSEMVQVG